MTAYLTRAQLVAALGVSERTYERWLQKGYLDAYSHKTAGGHRRFNITAEQIGEIKACLGKHAQSRGSSSGTGGSGTPAGTTERHVALDDYRWVQRTLAKRRLASRPSSPRAAPKRLPPTLAAMLD